MSNYIFAPSPTCGISEHEFVTWRDAFTTEELDRMVKHLETLEKQKAQIGGVPVETEFSDVRASRVAWLSLTQESQWIYDRLARAAREINGQYYKFDLYGFSEDMQYTVYDSAIGPPNHYSWHLDCGSPGGFPPRKLSMVLQLSDPSEYEGGDLEIQSAPTASAVMKQRGLIAAFPSFRLHRVTPVTSGVRRTLVVWICGPSFR